MGSLFNEKPIKPLLRWAGGKSWLSGQLTDVVGDLEFENYHEPFLGGGAVFFTVKHTGIAYLSDTNSELIDTYQAVRDNPERVISYLHNYRNTEKFYYQLRSTTPRDFYGKAARFIFLNQTSYNGLFRVNQSGKYNVPYGFHKIYNVDEDSIMLVSKALKNAKFSKGDFVCDLNNVKNKDLVFLDPPYTVSHNDNGFIAYNKNLFSLEDQYRLAQYIKDIKNKGAYFILTNAAHSAIREIFGVDDTVIELERQSLIGGKNAKRGLIKELIFTNIQGG